MTIKNINSIGIILAIGIVLLLAAATVERNACYRDPVTLWADIAAKSPNKRRAHQNYGRALSVQGKYGQALEQFKTVFALKDDGNVSRRDIYREIGVVYFWLGLYDEAVAAAREGLRYAPEDPRLLNNLSSAYLKQQRYDEAQRYAEASLRANPLMTEPLNILGEVYLLRKDYLKAQQYFLMAIERTPEVPFRYWNAAVAFEQSGDLEGAMQYLDMFLARERNDRYRLEAIEHMARLKERIGHRR